MNAEEWCNMGQSDKHKEVIIGLVKKGYDARMLKELSVAIEDFLQVP
jgi:hypothetical protein